MEKNSNEKFKFFPSPLLPQQSFLFFQEISKYLCKNKHSNTKLSN